MRDALRTYRACKVLVRKIYKRSPVSIPTPIRFCIDFGSNIDSFNFTVTFYVTLRLLTSFLLFKLNKFVSVAPCR